MVGKTPQVREIVYNVLDDNGERTVIAKGATTVDVGDTKQLFTRTSNLEALTANNVSNISTAQSNILQLQTFLASVIPITEVENIYSPILGDLQGYHTNNVVRIVNLEEGLASNASIIDGNFSNISNLQTDFSSNISRIDTLEAVHASNALIVSNNFSNIAQLQTDLSSNNNRIVTLENDISLVTNFGDITTLQSDVEDLKDRITSPDGVTVGGNAGQGNPDGQATIIGIEAGRNIGAFSIAIGTRAQDYSIRGPVKSTVINATGNQLNAPRTDTLVIAPVQTDDSNTINIMGYNETTKEIVQTTLLRGIDNNVHVTTNISVNSDTILLETNGNGSFGGDIEIAGTLEVGGSSSFTGAMQVDDTLEIADTSSFGGDMTVDANAFVYGQSFIVCNGPANKIILRNDGTGSFLSDVDIGGTLEVGGTSSFTGAMQMADTLEVGSTSSFGGNMTVNANMEITGQSFAIGGAFINSGGIASFSDTVTATDIKCNETLDVYNEFRLIDDLTRNVVIDKLGTSSFEGKMSINNELVVAQNASFYGGIVVPSSASSFGGPIQVNDTATFSHPTTFDGLANVFIESQSFVVGTDKAHINSDGHASFAETVTAKNIDCNEVLDVFDSFRLKDSASDTVYATINKDGVSSFAGAMQINDNLTMSGTFNVGGDKFKIDPGVATTNFVQLRGGLSITNSSGENVNASITDVGVANFQTSVTSDGTGSFGTLNCGDTTTSTTGSFGTLNCGGTANLNGLSLSGDAYMTLQAGSSENDYCVIKQVGGNNAYKLVFDFYDDANELRFGLRSNDSEKHTWNEGNYTATGTISAGTDLVVTSDERLKTGITQIPNAIEKVKQIRGCTYTMDDKPSAGVIAQELIKVLPETVHTKDDGYYGVSYHGVIGLLVEAVKELSEKIK